MHFRPPSFLTFSTELEWSNRLLSLSLWSLWYAMYCMRCPRAVASDVATQAKPFSMSLLCSLLTGLNDTVYARRSVNRCMSCAWSRGTMPNATPAGINRKLHRQYSTQPDETRGDDSLDHCQWERPIRSITRLRAHARCCIGCLPPMKHALLVVPVVHC